MLNRRFFMAGAAATIVPAPLLAERSTNLPQRFRPQTVAVNSNLPSGRIYVRSSEHFLYWTLGNGRAVRYGVALGSLGRQFRGSAIIRRKARWPSWRPTQNMIRLEPQVYGPYASGLPGGHEANPLGARALYLYRNGRDTMFRIHGTPQPESIGQSFSSGCIRLRNDHISQLYDLVPTGTIVVAM